MNHSNIRVRFAPSPTGALHIGGVRTALFNYLFAKRHGGAFILRIEDTDQNRYVAGAEEYIVESLEWLGLIPDESPQKGGEYGPYRQSERKALYKEYAISLVQSGHAYFAFDTQEELEDMRRSAQAQGQSHTMYGIFTRGRMRNSLTISEEEVQKLLNLGVPYVIRMKIPEDGSVLVKDLIRSEVVFDFKEMDDKVLYKSDGMPTYHLANVVDDHLMCISHVIRGEEWLSSTGHHVLLHRWFGWEDNTPQFAHLPLILKPDGKGKLSKRDGKRLGIPVFPISWNGISEEDSFTGFRELGFEPNAVINFLALLGWNPGTDQEIFSLDELSKIFSLDRVNKSGARFDFEKAKWFNQAYLRQKTGRDIAQEMIKKGLLPPDIDVNKLAHICDMLKDRVTTIKDIPSVGHYFFGKPQFFDIATLDKKWSVETPQMLSEVVHHLETLEFTDRDSIEQSLKSLLQKNQWGIGQVFPFLRIAISGNLQGPDLFEMMFIIGKKETIERISELLKSRISMGN